MRSSFAVPVVFIASAFFFACGSGNKTPEADQNTAPKPLQLAQNTTAEQQAQVDFTWFTDWDKGIEEAKKTKKPVVVDFYADWCVYCKKMDKETFSAPEIKKRLADGWIGIRLNAEKGDLSGTYDGKTMTYPQLTQYFGVTGFPSFLFIDKELKPMRPVPGFIEKDTFGPMLDFIKDEVYKKNVSFQDYMKSRK
ncbi:thioredoxin fold domain-containing protein [bacterium]|nr:thioredoxin fold domain-containing protein [bacterium]